MTVRVAIVGSGPSAFYAADSLLKHADPRVEVDMYELLPTPWGLVRAGVAPDHPNIKAVSRVFERIASRPGFRFFGNVAVGADVSRKDLLERYHAVIYAYGTPTDRRLGIPGEDLPGNWAATELVAWYNGHPHYRELDVDLSSARVAVVGNGNVALDLARMLALTPQELACTDVADHALEALRASRVREIVVLGRRGPAQAAFTNPELRELGEMTDADVSVDPTEVELDEASRGWLEHEGSATARKNVEILTGYARRSPRPGRRRIVLRFLVSPVRVLGGERVDGLEVVRNELDAALRARRTDATETLPVGLVFRAIGYRGVPLDGVPFDQQRGVIANEGGRVLGSARGEYAVGWIKRGPTGVIGTNKRDAQESVTALLEDLQAGRLARPSRPDPGAVSELLRLAKPDHVTYAGWEAIDAVERERGAESGRPRVKLCSLPELLEAAHRG